MSYPQEMKCSWSGSKFHNLGSSDCRACQSGHQFYPIWEAFSQSVAQIRNNPDLRNNPKLECMFGVHNPFLFSLFSFDCDTSAWSTCKFASSCLFDTNNWVPDQEGFVSFPATLCAYEAHIPCTQHPAYQSKKSIPSGRWVLVLILIVILAICQHW